MFKLIADFLLSSLALYLVSYIIDGVNVENFYSAMIAVIVIAIINAIIRPILLLLTLPINILTLGLFTFVINALLFMLAGKITPGLIVSNFGSALLGSLIFTIIKMVFHGLVKR